MKRNNPTAGNVLASQSNIQSFNESAGDAYHIFVEVEWNGRPPNGTFYDRIHALGIWVNKGDRNEFPTALQRRASTFGNPAAIVSQEGVYLCKNEDIAKIIANLADEAGAEAIYIGRRYSTVYRITDPDLAAYRQYIKGVSKRGPKPREEHGVYTVTCFYEVRSFEAELDAQPVTCPGCGTWHFTAHIGKGKAYPKPNWKKENGGMSDYWYRTRFGESGKFEIPLFGVKAKTTPPLTFPKDVPSLPALVDVPDAFVRQMEADANFALHVYDLLYCLTSLTETERVTGRLKDVIGLYISQGGRHQLFMGIPANGYDLIDLCILDRDLMKYL